jgi:hypothetical protein
MQLKIIEIDRYEKSKKRRSSYHQKLLSCLKDEKQILQFSCEVTVLKFLRLLRSITITHYLCVLLSYSTRFYEDLSRLHTTTLSLRCLSQTDISSAKRRLHSWLLSFASRSRMIEKQSKRISSAEQRIMQRIELSSTRWKTFAVTSFIQTLANKCKYVFSQ